MEEQEIKFYSVRVVGTDNDLHGYQFCVAAISLEAAKREALERDVSKKRDLTDIVIEQTTELEAKTCYGWFDYLKRNPLNAEEAYWLGCIGTAGAEPLQACYM